VQRQTRSADQQTKPKITKGRQLDRDTFGDLQRGLLVNGLRASRGSRSDAASSAFAPVPPGFAALSRLRDPAIAEEPAAIIFARIIDVVTPTRGHDVGHDRDGFYARARTQTAGPERELRDLGGKARKAVDGKLSGEVWIDAWAALPDRTKRRLWRPRLVERSSRRQPYTHRTADATRPTKHGGRHGAAA